MPEFTVRPITDAETLRRCVLLQAQIWVMDEADAVPHHQLVAAASAGGLVLGGFAPDGELVGFSFAFPGWRRGPPFLYSHMTGVLAAHRGAGLGFRLKCAQRQAALAAGIDHIVWTYDPLQEGNARFNLGRLGAIAARYHPDYYGVMTDGINRGLPSDRFEVDWFLRSRRVDARLRGETPPAAAADAAWALEGAAGGGGHGRRPGRPRVDLADARIRVEVPRDLARLKSDDPDAALAWRMATRTVFQHYLSQGYCGTEAGYVLGARDGRVAYQLERGDQGRERVLPESLGTFSGRLPLRPYPFTWLPRRGAAL